MTGGILLILDGWGPVPPSPAHPTSAARTPVLDHLLASFPVWTLDASGSAVGLPRGVVGNSEIGHLVIGAGRALEYDSLLVQREAEAGRLRMNTVLASLCEKLAASGGTLHMAGLVSDGRIHSDISHLGELLQAAGKAGLTRVAVHAITDGRDVPNGTAPRYLEQLQQMMADAGTGGFASLIGRNYAMDKSGNTSLTARACDLILDGVAEHYASHLTQMLAGLEGGDDLSVPATAIAAADGAARRVTGGDAILFANFRSDRTAPLADMIARQLAETGRGTVQLLSLAQYDTEHPIPALVPRADATGGLADALGAAAIRSVRIAGREKFEHVTFFINGRDPATRPLEEHVCVPGGAESDYTKAPQMNADGVADAVRAAAQRPEIGVVIANLANIDVVGHTGDYQATVTATEAVDAAVGQIAEAAQEHRRWLLIVGDHGNGEQMTQAGADGIDIPYGGHTVNPVPAVIVPVPNTVAGSHLRPQTGTLADIAPTMLRLLGCAVGAAMKGSSLI